MNKYEYAHLTESVNPNDLFDIRWTIQGDSYKELVACFGYPLLKTLNFLGQEGWEYIENITDENHLSNYKTYLIKKEIS